MRLTVLALALALVPLAGCAGDERPPYPPPEASPSAGPPPAAAADAGPDWSFTDTKGVQHSRDSSAGEPVVLFFMATWCSSCRHTAPMLARVHADVAPNGTGFYSIDFDPTESDDDLRAWKEQYAQDWPHGRDPDGDVVRTFGIRTQSSVVVLDTHGRVVQKWGYGQVDEDGLRNALALAATA